MAAVARVVVVGLAVTAAHPRDARGDEAEDRVAAEALFADATRLLVDKQFDLACVKFEEVSRLQPGKVGAMSAVSECYAAAGRLVAAVVQLRRAIDRANQVSDSRVTALVARLDELDAKLPRLTVVVPSGPARGGVRVLRDGVDVPPGQWGTAIPVDPGRHTVELSVPGRPPFSRQQIELREGDRKTVTIEVAAFMAIREGGDARRSQASVAPWIVGGVGVAGLLAGGILGAVVLDAKAKTDAECDHKTLTCPADAVSAADTGRTLGPISTVSFVVGGLGVGVGAVWLLTRAPATPNAEPRRAALAMGPAIAADGAGWRWQGAW